MQRVRLHQQALDRTPASVASVLRAIATPRLLE